MSGEDVKLTPLEFRLLGQVEDEDAQAGGHRPVAGGPVAQDADDLLVAERTALDRDRQQAIRRVVNGVR